MKYCEECMWYDDSECVCTMDGDPRHPQTMACGEFEDRGGDDED